MQENSNLAHYLFPYDNGKLNDIILNGDKDLKTDLHSLNAAACSIPRDNAKTLWFGLT